jgi:hypothetical protein
MTVNFDSGAEKLLSAVRGHVLRTGNTVRYSTESPNLLLNNDFGFVAKLARMSSFVLILALRGVFIFRMASGLNVA